MASYRLSPAAPKEARQKLEENFFLPANMKEALTRDLLLAHFLFNQEYADRLTSPEEGLRAMAEFVSTMTEFKSPEKQRDLIIDLLDEASLFVLSKSPKEATRLYQGLYKKPGTKKARQQTIAVSNGTLVCRCPKVPSENEGQTLNLAKVISLAMRMMKIKVGDVKVIYDESLGSSCNLLAKIERSISLMETACSLATSQAGEAIELSTGLRANLPEILASIKVARRNTNLTRKFGKAEKVTADTLRKTLNIRFGLEESGSDPWVCSFLKGLFNEVTKPYTSYLPGEFMHSLRVRNQCSSDAAILAKMGYVGLAPATIKVEKVLLSRTESYTEVQAPKAKDPKTTTIGKGTEVVRSRVVPLNEDKFPEGANFREYRCAVTTVLPMIDPGSNIGPRDQIKGDSLTPRSEYALSFYKKNSELVDAANTAFAIMSSIPNKGSKATPEQFNNARNRYIGLSANIGFFDATGKEYQKYSEIPDHTRKFLEKLFRRKVATVESLNSSDNEEDGDAKGVSTKTRPSSVP